jgi:hypothetical protein
MNLDQLQEDKDVVVGLSSAKICGASEWCNNNDDEEMYFLDLKL